MGPWTGMRRQFRLADLDRLLQAIKD